MASSTSVEVAVGATPLKMMVQLTGFDDLPNLPNLTPRLRLEVAAEDVMD
jgi:hypothetical protein